MVQHSPNTHIQKAAVWLCVSVLFCYIDLISFVLYVESLMTAHHMFMSCLCKTVCE